MSQQIQRRRVGDTLTVLSVTIQQPGTDGEVGPVNLTGKTVQFKMVNVATDEEKVALSSVTVDNGGSGHCYYRFAAGDVDTAGKFAASFVVTDSARTDHFPVASQGLIVLIDSDTQTAEEAYREAVGATA